MIDDERSWDARRVLIDGKTKDVWAEWLLQQRRLRFLGEARIALALRIRGD
jgi:hypothetical protein